MHNKYTQEEKSCMIESIDKPKHLHLRVHLCIANFLNSQ